MPSVGRAAVKGRYVLNTVYGGRRTSANLAWAVGTVPYVGMYVRNEEGQERISLVTGPRRQQLHGQDGVSWDFVYSRNESETWHPLGSLRPPKSLVPEREYADRYKALQCHGGSVGRGRPGAAQMCIPLQARGMHAE